MKHIDTMGTNDELTEQRIAYALLRVAVGVDFLGHGFIRLLHGNAVFAQWMVKHMAEAPLPAVFVYGFGWILPFIEAALGILLIGGLFTRWALIAASLLMIALLVGITLIQEWATAGLQLNYCLILSILLFLRIRYDTSWMKLLRGI